jgi:hypothetical protein
MKTQRNTSNSKKCHKCKKEKTKKTLTRALYFSDENPFETKEKFIHLDCIEFN